MSDKSSRPSNWPLVGIALAVAGAVALWCLYGCGPRPATIVEHVAAKTIPAAPLPTSTREVDAELKQAHAERDDLAQQIDAKDKRIGLLENDKVKLHDRDLQRRLAWFSAVALILVLADVAGWFVLPSGLKIWAVRGGLACLGVSAAALALRAMVPYREVAGIVMIGGTVAFSLWKQFRLQGAGAQAANYGERMEDAFAGMKDWVPAEKHQLIDDLIASVKHSAAMDQAEAGVRGVLAAIRGKSPTAPTVAPPVPPSPPKVI